MNYVILTHEIEGGGIQMVVRSQAKCLAEHGHTVTVVCNRKVGNIADVDYEVIHIPFHTWRGRFALKKQLSALADVRILAHSFDAYWALFWLPRFADKAYLWVHVNYHAMYYRPKTPLKNFERTFNFRLLFNRKNMVFVSKGAEAAMLMRIGIKPAASHIIHPSIDIERIHALAATDISTTHPQLPENFYVWVGRLAARKNASLAITAFAKFCEPGEHLVMVGDGGERRALETLADTLGIAEKVVFVGWQDNPYAVMARAKALLMSSNIEGCPVYIMEALALGIPVVSTDAQSGPREILSPTYADGVCACEDVAGMVKAVKRLRANRAQKRFAPAALRAHAERFGEPAMIRRLLELTLEN